MNINVPEQTATVQELGRHELATKISPAPAAARLVAKRVSAPGAEAPAEGGVP